MPRFIIRIHDDKSNEDYYLEWSTIVDAPITHGMSLENFKEYIKEEYSNKGLDELNERLERVKEKGTSLIGETGSADFFLTKYNRAGDNKTFLNKEGILEKYCRNVPQSSGI